jgi:small-conductance mechanosensitive channel
MDRLISIFFVRFTPFYDASIWAILPIFMDQKFFGNSLATWATALGVACGLFLFLLLVRTLLVHGLKKQTKKQTHMSYQLIRDLLLELHPAFLLSLALYCACHLLKLTPDESTRVGQAFAIISLMQLSTVGGRAIHYWEKMYLKKKAAVDVGSATSLGLIRFTAKFCLYLVLVLLGIHSLGFNITTLLAGLGIGGIAVALALQNLLGDLFASLTIVLDKPYVVDDFIVIGEFAGTIEQIGLKTTRLRSLSGELLIFSNSDLLQSRVRNYKQMAERRVIYTIGLTYDTPALQVERAVKMLEEIIRATPGTRFDRCNFLSFGASSLNIEVVYFVLSRDFNEYAKLAEKINLETLKQFNAAELSFAFPSQTIYLEDNR